MNMIDRYFSDESYTTASTPLISGIAFSSDCSIPAFSVMVLIEQELHAPSSLTLTI
jgi:hypothetical protein